MTHDRSSTEKLWKNEYEFEVDKDLLLDEKNIVYLVLGPPAFISNIVEDVYTKFGGSSSGEYSCIDVSHSYDTSISLQMKALARKRTLSKSVVAISGFDRAKVFDKAVMVVGEDLEGSKGIDKRGLFDYIYQLTDSSSEISGFVVLLLFEDEHGSSFPSLRNYSSGELDEAEPVDWKAWFASISESDSLNINGAALAGRISRAAVYYPPSIPSPSTTTTTTTSLSSKSFCERFQPNQWNSPIYGSPSTAALVSLVVVLVLTVVMSYKWLFKVRTDSATDSSSSLVSSLSSSDSDSATSSSTKDAPSTASSSSSSYSSNGNGSSGSNSTTTTATIDQGSSNNSSELSSAIHTTSSITSSDNLTAETNRTTTTTTTTTTTIKKQQSKGRNSKKPQSKEGVVGSPPPSPAGGSTTSNTTPDKGNPPSHDHYLRSSKKKSSS